MNRKLSREKIIEATLNLIDEKGSSKIGFREIAAKLDCDQERLYDYFNDYNDVLFGAINSIVENMGDD